RFEDLQINVPVITLFHPTVFVNIKWDLFKIDWTNLKLVNIGAWYRNTFSIYRIKVPPQFKKMILKGPKMEDYLPPSSFILTKFQILNPSHENKWIYYLCLYLQEAVDWSQLPNDFTLHFDPKIGEVK